MRRGSEDAAPPGLKRMVVMGKMQLMVGKVVQALPALSAQRKERKEETVKTTKIFAALSLALVFIALPAVVLAAGNVEKGKKVVDSRHLGNCAACHVVPGMEFPGDVGPDLVKAMQHYSQKDREKVWQWVWDGRKFDPDTIMPPFGPNKILTKEQVDEVVDYLYSLKKK